MTWKRGHDVNVLDEEHHRIYGSKWALGLDQRNFLIRSGLRPQDRLLDLGCGAGRAGVHLIPYLEREHYVGIDGHGPSLQAFREYEIPLHQLEDRGAKLVLHDAATGPLPFESDSFDAVLAFSVFNHMIDATPAVGEAVRVLRRGGRLFAAMGPPSRAEVAGLRRIERVDLPSQLVEDKTIEWSVYERT